MKYVKLTVKKLRFKVTIKHELHDHVDRFISSAHTEEFDNVSVVKPLHHVCLT